MDYMNKKAQEEMEQREYLARMTPKQREQYEKEMYLREQEYYRQMQNAPREQNMMPNQPSNEDYEREQYLKYLQEKQMAENKPSMTNRGGYLIFVKKKFLRLVVPYFCFSVLSLGLKLLFSSFTRSSVDLFSSIYGIVCEGKYFWFWLGYFEFFFF